MSVKLAVVGNNIAVIVRITHAYTAVIVNSNIMVAVSYIKFLNTAICFYTPMKGAVFFGDGKYCCYVGDKVVIVKALLNYIKRFVVKVM